MLRREPGSASTASLLSAIASLLSFCIECTNDNDMMAVQYYLALEKQSVANPVAVPAAMSSTVGLEDPEGDLEDGANAGHETAGNTGTDSPIALTPGSPATSFCELNIEEKKRISKYRGLRLKLSRSLTQIWHS